MSDQVGGVGESSESDYSKEGAFWSQVKSGTRESPRNLQE